MRCDALFQKIDNIADGYVNVWEDVCNIESPSAFKQGVDDVGEYFIKLAKARGWKTEVFEQPVSGNVVCITLNPDSSAPPVALSGHIDTVHPAGSFGSPAVKIADGKIFGPGTADCKGGCVAAFLAMDALERVGFCLRPVMLLLQSDEEVGSRTSNKSTIRQICEKAKDSVAFLNLEGSANGKACIKRKGIINYKFTVTGAEAHSSKCADEGANAIVEAAHKIIKLETLKDPNGVTCNCGTISGGTVCNTVAGMCTFDANIRFPDDAALEKTKEFVKNVADTVHVKGCSCKAEITSFRVAMPLERRNIDLLSKMNEIFKQNGLSVLEPCSRGGGSDASDVTAYGIPCVDSLGVNGNFIHSPKEFAYISSLSEAAKRIASVVYCI